VELDFRFIEHSVTYKKYVIFETVCVFQSSYVKQDPQLYVEFCLSVNTCVVCFRNYRENNNELSIGKTKH